MAIVLFLLDDSSPMPQIAYYAGVLWVQGSLSTGFWRLDLWCIIHALLDCYSFGSTGQVVSCLYFPVHFLSHYGLATGLHEFAVKRHWQNTLMLQALRSLLLLELMASLAILVRERSSAWGDITLLDSMLGSSWKVRPFDELSFVLGAHVQAIFACPTFGVSVSVLHLLSNTLVGGCSPGVITCRKNVLNNFIWHSAMLIFCSHVRRLDVHGSDGKAQASFASSDSQQDCSAMVRDRCRTDAQWLSAESSSMSHIKQSSMLSHGSFVLGTGAAFAEKHYSHEEVISAFHEQRRAAGDSEYDADFAERVFAKCGFDSNSIALPPQDLFRPMSRPEYLQHREATLLHLAERACLKALEMWGGSTSDISHLYWGTMTGGMQSPSMDVLLTQRLQLSPDVERVSIENMGCLTGFRLINVAKQAVDSNPAHRVLVVVADVRSAIGNLLPTPASRSDIVSCALFRDGASAAVLGGGPLKPEEMACYEIFPGKSRLLEGSEDLVDYREIEHGKLRLHLHTRIPQVVHAALPSFTQDLLERVASETGHAPPLSQFDVVCHTGGPKILKAVAEALGMGATQLEASWGVMKAHGNLSGASNLAALDHHNRCIKPERDWVLCLSMGPGLCLEGVVLRRKGGK
eukprot:TRINITY_DN65832_c0_g1_i1.p1 TRINITY_DN65832_c0_g1~~TRINITY_DN65832_c0_g1_i1.p1  ORF type:complete len:695 (+),score=87.24 TRINITY_DN65832_c0_g1_i1:194-2086(+)